METFFYGLIFLLTITLVFYVISFYQLKEMYEENLHFANDMLGMYMDFRVFVRKGHLDDEDIIALIEERCVEGQKYRDQQREKLANHKFFKGIFGWLNTRR